MAIEYVRLILEKNYAPVFYFFLRFSPHHSLLSGRERKLQNVVR